MNFDRPNSRGATVLGLGLILPEPKPTTQAAPSVPMLAAGPAYACAELPPAGDVSPRLLRRLARAQRLALGATHLAVTAAGSAAAPDQPVAVAVGTGLGGLAETASFLENMIRQREGSPKPASFIFSVHNCVAGQVAIAHGLNGPNNTFVQESISFELALWNALRLVQTGRAARALAVGVDEVSPYVITTGQTRGWLRKDPAPLDPMSASGPAHTGTLSGEGAAALMLGPPDAPAQGQPLPRIAGANVEPLPEAGLRRVDAAAEADFIARALDSADTALDQVDLVLFGANGHSPLDAAYAQVARALRTSARRDIAIGVYKHLCGDFCTAAAVGLALAVRAVGAGSVPQELKIVPPGAPPATVSRVALYHLHETGYHSVSLVTA